MNVSDNPLDLFGTKAGSSKTDNSFGAQGDNLIIFELDMPAYVDFVWISRGTSTDVTKFEV